MTAMDIARQLQVWKNMVTVQVRYGKEGCRNASDLLTAREQEEKHEEKKKEFIKSI